MSETELASETKKVQQWRATMRLTESPNAIRWYPQRSGNDFFNSSHIPDEPLVLETGRNYTIDLPNEQWKSGWNSLVVCVSFKDLDGAALKSISFQFIANPIESFSEDSPPMVLEPDEIRDIPKTDYARLRLHGQVYGWPTDDDHFYFDISSVQKAETEPSRTFELHYIEAISKHPLDSHSEDYILYGHERPDHIIYAGPWDETMRNAAKVLAIAVTGTGSHAATLCYTNGHYHVELWDLRFPPATQDKIRPLRKPNVPKMPCARISFKSPDPNRSASMFISGSGSPLILRMEDHPDEGMRCLGFRCVPTAPVDHDAHLPWTLERILDLPKLVGNDPCQLAFHSINQDDITEENERCTTFEKGIFTVYNVDHSWRRVYTLHLDFLTQGFYCQSIRGGTVVFLDTRDRAVYSYELLTGWKIKSFHLKSDISGHDIQLSADGQRLAVRNLGSVEIYDIPSGISVGVYRDSNIRPGVSLFFGQEHLAILNTLLRKQDWYWSIVRVSDMSCTTAPYVSEDRLSLKGIPEVDIEDTELKISNTRSILSSAATEGTHREEVNHTNCQLVELAWDTVSDGSLIECESSAGSRFIIQPMVSPSQDELNITKIVFSREEEDGTTSASTEITIRSYFSKALIHPSTLQLYLAYHRFFQVWDLLPAGPRVCVLSSSRKIDYLTSSLIAKDCAHGQRLIIFAPDTDIATPGEVLVPISSDETFSEKKSEDLLHGVLTLVDSYRRCSRNGKREFLRYLKGRLNTSVSSPISCLVPICQYWKQSNKADLEGLLRDLLPANRVTWAPNANAKKNTDPLAIIIEISETEPAAFGVARIIIDYCVSQANRTRNLGFLIPFYRSLHKIMILYSEEALVWLGRIAFVTVPDRAYVIHNHAIAYPPTFRFQFWKSIDLPLSKMKDPILQLQFSKEGFDPSSDSFTRPVFMASFDDLWNYKYGKPARCHSNPELEMSTKAINPWWRTPLSVIRLKSQLRTKHQVECHDFDLSFFDNPAIAALVAYKWNTIGFSYWLFRFMFQCVYYFLVVITAIMQVYLNNPKVLLGVFGAIIVMAAVFIWLEAIQAAQGWANYKRSSYNILDLIAFLVPMAASIDQIVVVLQDAPNGNSRLLSFSVLLVFLHMLFELRVIRSVCKFVTIIQQAVLEIKVFFIIFASGILAFAIGLLHLLHACPLGGCDKEDPPAFPKHFFGALSSTYFFMGGRYDPVSDEFDSNDWAFHIMMMIFLFFTVILMLNVLIALINVAFAKGDDGWRLAWIESRLRFIESAENMSYNVPGFRQRHNWFPEEIYFTAAMQDVDAYRRRYRNKKAINDEELAETWERESEGEIEEEDKPIEEVSIQNGDDGNSGPDADAAERDGRVARQSRGVPASEKRSGNASGVLRYGSAQHLGGDVENQAVVQEMKSEITDLQQQLAKQQEGLTRQFTKQLSQQQERFARQLTQQQEEIRRDFTSQFAQQQERLLQELKDLLVLTRS